MDRRQFIQVSAWSSGGLLLSFVLGDAHEAKQDSSWVPNAWLRIESAGPIVFTLDKTEMGQGVYASLPLLLCEELEIDPEQLEIVFAPAAKVYGNPKLAGLQMTGGSTSLPVCYEPLRTIGAQVREVLREAAAKRWKVDINQCIAEAGTIRQQKTDERFRYQDLAADAAKLSLPSRVALKKPEQFRLIGKARNRTDSRPKVEGTAVFGIDVQIPELRNAVLLRSSVKGAKLVSFDATAAKAIGGVEDVLALSDGVAVVAKRYWQARKAADLVQAKWDESHALAIDDKSLRAKLEQEVDSRFPKLHQEPSKEDLGNNSPLEASFHFPFLAHAAMEPLNCTAWYRDGRCEIWASTQGPGLARFLVAEALGISPEKVEIHTTFLGGGFGRRLYQDFIVQAALLAKAVQKPIKLIWSREEDMQHDFYRPATSHKVRIYPGKDGKVFRWEHALAGPSLLAGALPQWSEALLPQWLPASWRDGIGNTLGSFLGSGSRDATATEGVADSVYAFAEREVHFDAVDLHLDVGFWRSVGHSYNAFVTETLMDELAQRQNIDPFVFRKLHLEADLRHLKVLEKLREVSAWDTPAPAGVYRGMALHKSFGTICGQVVEIKYDPKSPAIRLHKVYAVVDCGLVVQPNVVEAQVSGAIVFAMSAALWGQISVQAGAVTQTNFHNYPIARMSDCPPIEVHTIASTEEPTGIGEPGVPPFAPALANALSAATQRRYRTLPLVLTS